MSRRHVPKIIPKVLQELLLILLGCILLNVLQRLLDPDYRLLRSLRLLSGPEFYTLVTICIYLAVAFLIFSLRRLWDLRAKVMALGVADNLLRQDHRFLQELIDVIPTPVFYKDTDGRYRLCNSAFQEAVDLPRNEIIGRTVFDVVPAGLAERYDKMDRAAWTNRTTQFYESRFLSAEGVARDVILTHALHYDDQGEPAGLVGVMTDISDMKRLEVQLKESESLFRTLAQSSLIGVALHDGLSLVYINNTLEQITGYSRDELLGMQPWDLLHPEAKDSLRPIIAVLLKERAFAAVRTEGRIVTRDGRARWIQCYAETVEYDGRNVVLGNFIDITERKELEEKMRVMATVDKLTQSFNRSRLDEILNCEIARVRRYERPLSIIMFDLDHFKKINDTFGHPTGDKVLAMTAEIVKGSIRRTDYLGRWGGEEFLIVLPETSMEAAYDLAEKLRRIVDTYPYETVESVTASFGVAEFDEETNFDLLKRVDEALYLAKHRGRNRVEVSLQSEPIRQYALPLC